MLILFLERPGDDSPLVKSSCRLNADSLSVPLE